MRWKAILLIGIGLVYYSYIRENTDRVMRAYDNWRMSYLTAINNAMIDIESNNPNIHYNIDR